MMSRFIYGLSFYSIAHAAQAQIETATNPIRSFYPVSASPHRKPRDNDVDGLMSDP